MGRQLGEIFIIKIMCGCVLATQRHHIVGLFGVLGGAMIATTGAVVGAPSRADFISLLLCLLYFRWPQSAPCVDIKLLCRKIVANSWQLLI